MTNLRESEIIDQYDRPWAFYALATAGTWGSWFLAAWFSRQTDGNLTFTILTTVFLVFGLLFPFMAAWWLVWPNPILRADLAARLVRFGPRERKYALLATLTMLGSILLAQLISLLFGYSVDQFRLAKGASFQAGILSGWMALIIAPIIEELSWHSYGTDTLRRKMSLFWTSIVFALYWVFWHAPLGAVEGYYQSEVVETGPLFTLNLVLSIFPFVLLMNWFYYRANRSILVAILFHLGAGIFNEMFQTDPMSKVIQTGLLTLLTIVLIYRDRSMFFSRTLETSADTISDIHFQNINSKGIS